MGITDIKNAFKIADVEFVKGSTKLNFKYLPKLFDENQKPLSQNILTEKYSSVYIVVIDGKIKKMRTSKNNLSMKNTLDKYQDGGINGIPNVNNAKIWFLLYSYILKGKKIEFYMVCSEDFKKYVL